MTQLCLTLSPPGSTDALDHAASVIAASGAVSVVIEPADGVPLTAQSVLPIVAIIQQAGAAALLADDAHLARTVKADGVHLVRRADDIMGAYEEARSILGGGAIVGADAGASRHDAMSLGEAGADYVAFNLADGDDSGYELVAWWAEIFEVPVVAYGATSVEAVQDLAAAGADFVAVPLDLLASQADGFARAFAGATTAPVA